MKDEKKARGIDPLKEKFNLFPIQKHIAFFLIGWLGLSVIATIFAKILVSIYNSCGIDLDLEANAKYLSAVEMIYNFLSYLSLVVILLLICGKDSIKKLIQQFKNKNALIDGVAYGLFLLLVSAGVTLFIIKLRGGDTTSNENQSSIETMAQNWPIAIFIMTVLFAPICEEMTYRLGLYNALRRKNRWLAYALTSLIFAFIHFSIPSTKDQNFKATLINELWNIPSYIVSGVILCRAYEKHQNIATSMIAHAINNFVAIVVTIISTLI